MPKIYRKYRERECPSSISIVFSISVPNAPLLREYDEDEGDEDEGNEGNEDGKYSESNGNDYHEDCSAPVSSAVQVVVNSPRADKTLITVQEKSRRVGYNA